MLGLFLQSFSPLGGAFGLSNKNQSVIGQRFIVTGKCGLGVNHGPPPANLEFPQSLLSITGSAEQAAQGTETPTFETQRAHHFVSILPTLIVSICLIFIVKYHKCPAQPGC